MNINIDQVKFLSFLKNRVQISRYEYKYLRSYLTLFENGEVDFESKMFFNQSENGWVLFLFFADEIFANNIIVYGENWHKIKLKEIKQSVDLSKFRTARITGNAELIMTLLYSDKVEGYSPIKERVFYRTNSVEPFELLNARIAVPNEEDASELSVMMKQYYHEEYNGKNDKRISDMNLIIAEHIKDNSILVLKNQNQELISFCTIVDPDIGILFTNKRFRNCGYGKMILSHCSKILLSRNEEVFLMTDKMKIESNSACKRIGFCDFFNYIDIVIKNK